MTITILHGDCRSVLATLPERSVQTVVTSPPYYGLRRYSDDPREIGQEAQPDCLAWARREPPCGACYVCAMREVFAGLWRVLRDDGVVWLNLGDSYAQIGGRGAQGSTSARSNRSNVLDQMKPTSQQPPAGLKEKDLLGIPWRVALALQADGWYLRSDIVWSKPNCMPESVTDRPTRAHEYVFLLAKSARYFYDSAAIAETNSNPKLKELKKDWRDRPGNGEWPSGTGGRMGSVTQGRNRRTVWSIATQPYSGAHYATMPEALIEPCVLAGSAAQACEHCGAPWVRVVERGEEIPLGHSTSRKATDVIIEYRGESSTRSSGLATNTTREKVTTGFTPSCTCPDNTGSAASIVLDPFGGSGTVGRVALRLQRRAILIELNGDYIEQHIEKRTNNLQVEMQL